MAAVMRQGTKAQSGGLVTGPDWSASQVVQPVDLSARKDGNGVTQVTWYIKYQMIADTQA